MAIHCSILAWGIPWTEEPGRLQSTGSRRVGHDRVTKHSISNRRNIVTSSIKTLRMVPIRKKKKKKIKKKKKTQTLKTKPTPEILLELSSEVVLNGMREKENSSFADLC